MKFSIITPTHNRPKELLRCVVSVLSPSPFPKERGAAQTNLEVKIIIINDSPEYDYSIFENDKDIIEAIENKKIIYIKNKENKGKNYSCNLALAQIVTDRYSVDNNHYIILLDDDDWLSLNALDDIEKEILLLNNSQKSKHRVKWLVTNRALENGERLTKNNTNKQISSGVFKINYFWDYLITRKFSGDATHIIDAQLAKQASFSKYIKNGEEWYYFAQLTTAFIYKDLNTTITDGYQINGLTDKLKSKYIENTYLLWRDKLLNNKIFIYLILRTFKSLKNKYL